MAANAVITLINGTEVTIIPDAEFYLDLPEDAELSASSNTRNKNKGFAYFGSIIHRSEAGDLADGIEGYTTKGSYVVIPTSQIALVEIND